MNIEETWIQVTQVRDQREALGNTVNIPSASNVDEFFDQVSYY
jgi:hypothetical protein